MGVQLFAGKYFKVRDKSTNQKPNSKNRIPKSRYTIKNKTNNHRKVLQNSPQRVFVLFFDMKIQAAIN